MALVTKNDVTQIFAIQAPSIDLPPTFANYPRGWDTARSNNGKPIHIFIAVRGGYQSVLKLVIGGVTIFDVTYDTPAWIFYPVSVIIPNDTDYSFTWTVVTPSDLLTWSELR